MFTIKNDLKKLSLNDYTELINSLKIKLDKFNFVISCYQFGSIGSPGISDIDLIFVLQDLNFESNKNLIIELIKNLDNSDYLFYHPAIIVSQNDFSLFSFFYNKDSIKLIFGSQLDLDLNYNFNDEQYLLWNSYFIQDFLSIKKRKNTISLRYLLLLSNNIAYCIRNNDLLLNTKYYPEIKNKVNLVRELSFSKDMEKISNEVNNLYGELYEKLVNQERLFLKKRFSILFDIKNRKIFFSVKTILYFRFWKIYFYGFPYRYFKARKEYIKTVDNLIIKRNINLKEFKKLREIFLSVKFFNF